MAEMVVRKVSAEYIETVEEIYAKIHMAEETGQQTNSML